MATHSENQRTSDLQPSLVPEVTSLTYRARSPEAQIPALAIRFLKTEQHKAAFEVSFADGERGLLHVQALEIEEGGWLLQLGESSPHDLKVDAAISALRCEAGERQCVLIAGDCKLTVGLENPFLTFEKMGKSSLASPGVDLNVGDAKMSFPLFKHTGGFGVSFAIAHQEIVYGGGEDFGSLAKNGRIYDIYNSDALGVNGQLRYQSTPYFCTSKGTAFALLNAAPSRIDVGARRHDILTWTTSTPALTLFVQPGGNAQKRISQFRTVTQRQAAVPKWSLGLWLSRCYYKDQKEVEQVLQDAEIHNIPVGVVNLDARCWMRAETRTDFVWDTSRFDPYQSFLPKLVKKGIEVCLWENPYVSSKTEQLYDEGVAKGYFAKTKQGNPYPLDWVPEGLAGFPKPPVAGLVDFTLPAARKWWKDQHRPYIRAGVKCFKTDFGEEIPADAYFADGSMGWDLRNVYSDLYNLCVLEVLAEECGSEGILWARSGSSRASSTPVKWAGDSQTTWRALRSTLRAGLSQAVGGAMFWSHDIGGFYGPSPDPDLYLRWAQVGLWGSHARCHGTSAREPWCFGEKTLNAFRQALELRLKVIPYFEASCARATKTNQSFLTPLWLIEGADPASHHIDDQFMAGPDVCVAPFLEAFGGRDFYLPGGSTWRDLRSGNILEGGRFFHTERTLHIPAFLRVGSHFEGLFEAAPRILVEKGR
jgi:alpha-D-xyloside xylohydrolase